MDFAGIKVGVIILLQDKYPCRIVEVHWAKPGKHGSAKKTVVGIDILTDKKHTDVFRSESLVREPQVTTLCLLVCALQVNGDMLSLDTLDNNNQSECLHFRMDDKNGVAKDLAGTFETIDGDVHAHVLRVVVNDGPPQERLIRFRTTK